MDVGSATAVVNGAVHSMSAVSEPAPGALTCSKCHGFDYSVYCSSACRLAHWESSHGAECIKRMPQRDKEEAEQYFDWLVRIANQKRRSMIYHRMSNGIDSQPLTQPRDVFEALGKVDAPFLIHVIRSRGRWQDWFLHSFRAALLHVAYDTERHPAVRLIESAAVAAIAQEQAGVLIERGWAQDSRDAKLLALLAAIRAGNPEKWTAPSEDKQWMLRQEDYDPVEAMDRRSERLAMGLHALPGPYGLGDTQGRQEAEAEKKADTRPKDCTVQ